MVEFDWKIDLDTISDEIGLVRLSSRSELSCSTTYAVEPKRISASITMAIPIFCLDSKLTKELATSSVSEPFLFTGIPALSVSLARSVRSNPFILRVQAYRPSNR